MKNLSLILFVFLFSSLYVFSQNVKLTPQQEMVMLINQENSKVLNSFNLDSASIETIKLVNKYRKSKGLNELSIDSSLMVYSKEYSEVLTSSNKTKHSDIELTSIKAENLYKESGFGMFLLNYKDLSKIPSNAVSSWKDSDTHNKNMLSTNVTKIGIGVYISNNNGYRMNMVMVVF
jgi:uncharacterized protein YkwD